MFKITKVLLLGIVFAGAGACELIASVDRSKISSTCGADSECGDPTAPICRDTACRGCVNDEDCANVGGGECNTDGSCTKPSCGDGKIEGNELCDGSDLQGEDCVRLGDGLYTGGSLGCTSNCTFDVAMCLTPAKACTDASECPTGSECLVATCNDNTCGTTATAGGTPVSAQAAGDCRKIVCDGSGTPESINDDTDVPDDGNPCTTDSCDAGMAVHANVSLGVSCGTQLSCNGLGACVANGDMAAPDMALPDMAAPDMAAPDMALPDMALPDMAPAGDMSSPPVLSNLTVLWSFNKAPTTTHPRWASTTGVTATVDIMGTIDTLSGGTLSMFAPGSCLPFEALSFSAGRVLQWSTGGNATCMASGTIAGVTNPTIGNFNAAVGAPLDPLMGPVRTDGYAAADGTSPMFDNPNFFAANLTSALASVAWAGNATQVGLQVIIQSTETINSTNVTYTLETNGGYAAGDLSSSELNSISAGVMQNGSSARIPVTASPAGVACSGTTSCFADVQLMFLDANTMALVYQIGGANPEASPDTLASLRGAVLLQAP